MHLEERGTGSRSRVAAKASAGRSSPAWLAEATRRFIGWIARERQIRRDRRALAALNERDLADIGLCRSDVVSWPSIDGELK